MVEDVDLEWFEELLKDCLLMCMLIFCNTLSVCAKRLDNGPQLFKICKSVDSTVIGKTYDWLYYTQMGEGNCSAGLSVCPSLG